MDGWGGREDLGGDEEGEIVHTGQNIVYGKSYFQLKEKNPSFNNSSSATVSYGHSLNVQTLQL